MATRKVLAIGDELLKKISKPVEKFDKTLWGLLDDMIETMYQYDGMGLAAPQVGVLRQVVIMDVNGSFLELINPEIVAEEGIQVGTEGCLSIVGVRKKVKRPMKVTVKAQDRYGNELIITGEKLLATCICHEVDHLKGILFVDIAEKEEV